METIELILVKPELSNNIGWGIEEPTDTDRELDRKIFVIPEGFELAKTTTGDWAFFDKEGHYSEICTNQKTKMPFLWDANGCNYFKSADLKYTKIRALRTAAGFTRQEFADYFEMSRRTLENWEEERRDPPDYLVKLFEYKLRTEGFIKE